MKKYRIIYKICILLLCMGSMAGCTQTGGVGTFETNSTGEKGTKTTFTKDEFLADYEKLWEILKENYIYFPVLENKGIDVEALEESTCQQLEDRITDLNGFYYLLSSMFGRMQYFAHLNVVDTYTYDIYQKYYNGESTENNGWQRYLQNSQTQTAYDYLAKSATSGSGKNHFQEVEASYDAQRKVITFRVTTFDDSVFERDRNFIREYMTTLGDTGVEHIIFDISGNTGGNDSYWTENIVAPFGGVYEWTRWCYLRDTELTRDYFFHDSKPKLLNQISNHKLPVSVEKLGLTHFIKFQALLSNEAVLKEDVCTAKRWVIINNQVYSAADSFSAFCKSTGWATLVGQPTLGDGTSITPILFSLPNTGLLISFSGVVGESPDGALNVLTGTIPDIWVKSPEDPRKLINRLIDETKVS